MDSETIWTTIILPLVIAPISWFLSKIYQNYENEKYNRKKEIYNIKRQEYELQLNQFLYPVYFKLLLIYQLDYNIPDNDNNLYDSESDSSMSIDNENSEEKVRCVGYYTRESGTNFKCRKLVPRSDKKRICKSCKWKYAKDKIKLRIDIGGIKPEILNRNDSYIQVHMPNELTNENLIEHNELQIDNRLKKMGYLKTTLEQENIEKLNATLHQLYIDVKLLIETNVHIIKPSCHERNIYVNFLRFIEMKTILKYDNKKIEKDFGQKNNNTRVLNLVEKKLQEINKKYYELLNNGTINY